MKAIVQRVNQAQVTVGDKLISKIQKGYLILLGISTDATRHDLNALVTKVLKLKLFPDSNGPWKLNIKQTGYEIIVVSQFTLFGQMKSNGQPSFHRAMNGQDAVVLYEEFIDELKAILGNEKVFGGAFGEYMQVDLQNDGPVTISLEASGTPDPSARKKKAPEIIY